MQNEQDDITVEKDGTEEAGNEEELEEQEARAETRIGKLRKELEQCQKDRQEYLDGWQRSKADYVNALKRFDKERELAMTAGTRAAAMAFLPALDSLERALAAGDAPEGWGGIAKQLENVTSSLGLIRFGESGESFDPALHEALGQDPAGSSGEDGTVTTVLERGWKLNGNVIRPAKVRVAHVESP